MAAAIAAWPACDRNTSFDGATAGDVDTGTAGARPVANLAFVLKDAGGRDVRLADLKGKPLLINFWATWCGPCKAEIPWFVEFSERYKAQGLTVLGISVDDSADEIKAYAAEHKVTYPLLVGRDRADVSKAFGAEDLIPVSWLVRADGSVQAKVSGIHSREWFEQQLLTMF